MKEITIVSGKGGTGKTSIVASFATVAKKNLLVDADVDAADLHLVMSPTVRYKEDFKGGHKAAINQKICTKCGKCIERCQYNAISADFIVNSLSCEGCGVCVHYCPVQAIDFPQRTCGEWYISDTPVCPMVHARLGIAEENSGLLVSLVRKQARILAEKQNIEIIIVDGPPGIGCPVIAAITGADAVLIVTEPTLSGMHDMDRIIDLTSFLNVPALLCVNKYDLNREISDSIINMAEKNNMQFVGSIPYDRDVTYAMVAGKSLIDFSNGKAALAVREVWNNIESYLQRGD